MIRIRFEPPNDPRWSAWRERCEATTRKHEAQRSDGEKPGFNSGLYGRVKDLAFYDPPFHGKCVFCEEKLSRNQHGDVEHFRPKAAVTDLQDCPVVSQSGEAHPGYWWLAYRWENLLPSCVLCNQPSVSRADGSRLGKRNRFPLVDETERAWSPDDDVDRERPLFINPALETPEDHLAVDHLGVMYAVAGSERGRACIEAFGLNDRDLPAARQEAYDTVVEWYTALTSAILRQEAATVKAIQKKLASVNDGSAEYCLARRAAEAAVKRQLAAVLAG